MVLVSDIIYKEELDEINKRLKNTEDDKKNKFKNLKKK